MESLLAALDSERRAEVAAISDLDELLERQLAQIAAAWPELAIDRQRYVRRLAAALVRRSGEPAERVLATMPAADLYLAAACAERDDAALATFRATLVPELRAVLGRLGAPSEMVGEIEQRVLVMLFVGDAPQIAGYHGRGRLKSWLRSIGVRTGRRVLGTLLGGGRGGGDELDALPGAVLDPELEVLRARYLPQVRATLATALAGLAERDRLLLRRHYLDGLTIDELAPLYRVNRATVARWIASAREQLLADMRQRLVGDHGIPPSEIDSVLRLVRSQLSVSFRD